MIQMNLFTKQKKTQKTNLWLAKGKGGGVNLEFKINRYALLYIKINSKDLLYSTGNNIQYLEITYHGKEPEKKMYIYM